MLALMVIEYEPSMPTGEVQLTIPEVELILIPVGATSNDQLVTAPLARSTTGAMLLHDTASVADWGEVIVKLGKVTKDSHSGPLYTPRLVV